MVISFLIENLVKNMKCYICEKRRITAEHYTEILTPDRQEIQEYDFAELCMECSRSTYSWHLNNRIKIIGNRFLYEKT